MIEDVFRCIANWICGKVKVLLLFNEDLLPKVDEQDEYVKAKEFRKRTFISTPDDYEWVQAYADKAYADIRARVKETEEKADSIIRHLGGGTVIVSLIAISNVNPNNAFLPILLLPSVFSAFWAIRLAIVARCPSSILSAPTVKDAIEYAEGYEKMGKAEFNGMMHEASMALLVSHRLKANVVDIAMRWYFRALCFLTIPLVIWPTIQLLRQNQPTPSCSQVSSQAKMP